MSKLPLVSVVLPFFNAKKTLSDAVQSIVSQTLEDFELILIDNASDDSGREIADHFARKDSRIRLVEEDQKGVVFAANKGFEEARGTYVARMDADDISFPDRLEAQVQFLENHPEIDLVSGHVIYEGDAVNAGFIRYVDWLNGIRSHEEISLNQFVEYPIVNPSIMLRKKVYERFGGYRAGDFPEDYEFFLRLLEKGVRMEKIKEPVLTWRDSPGRLTRTDDRYTPDAFFKIKAKYLAAWLKDHNPNHPDVCVWGAGKQAKKRSRYLSDSGIHIIARIDITDQVKESVIYYKEVGRYADLFILSYVSDHGAREKIREYLNGNGFQEGVNYLICG